MLATATASMRNKPELPGKGNGQCLVVTPEALRSSYTAKLSVRLARALAPEGSQARARLDSFMYIITYTHNKHVARAVVDAQVRLAMRLRELLKSKRVSKYVARGCPSPMLCLSCLVSKGSLHFSHGRRSTLAEVKHGRHSRVVTAVILGF